MIEALQGTETWQHGRVALVVVDGDDAVRSVLVEHVQAVDAGVADYPDLETFSAAVPAGQATVVVLGPSMPPSELLEAIRTHRRGQTWGVIMVVFELTPDVLQRALRSGVDDVVAVSAEDSELAQAIDRVAGHVLELISEPSGDAPVVAVDSGHGRRGTVVTIFCTKGGAGKTVTATNLAIALAQGTKERVVLVDADLQFGDVALMLQMTPTHTIAEAVAAGDRLDAALLESLLLRHEQSGISVLASPTEPGPADHITKADFARVIGVLRELCAYIVIDTSANFGEITIAALQASDQILVVAALDVMSLKSARVGLQTMRVLGLPFSRITFALNRANTKVGLSVMDAERALGMKADVTLPSELVVAESVNTGKPVVLGAPRSSKFAKGIRDLAGTLVSSAQAASQ